MNGLLRAHVILLTVRIALIAPFVKIFCRDWKEAGVINLVEECVSGASLSWTYERHGRVTCRGGVGIGVVNVS